MADRPFKLQYFSDDETIYSHVNEYHNLGGQIGGSRFQIACVSFALGQLQMGCCQRRSEMTDR